ncbi:unnamed protein product [Bursaphelenchus okinawaensis]|uniref:Uncharacterized protein n=1 Tax=Bursaphelenchus okinawaensis TaxID=465554 RepID=A0A811JWT8_9BILA|nr:unnamed protein product [Bursaphelenchus okinawaensis]CAG9086408.1 unnamed protein product [Bursaphelenchus okinawaensis]
MGKRQREHLLEVLTIKARRQKSCWFLIKVNLNIITLWIILNAGTFIYIRNQQDTLHRFTEEAELLKDSHIMSFEHCQFSHKYYSTPFDTSRCHDQCGTKAIAWRLRTLQMPFKRYEDVDLDDEKGFRRVNCHDSHKKCHPPPRKVPQCAGMAGTELEDHISYGERVLAPAISETDLAKALNKNVLASELVILCPLCRIQSDWFKVDGTKANYNESKINCLAKLLTIAPGWPRFAGYCDNTVSAIKPFEECNHFNDHIDTYRL